MLGCNISIHLLYREITICKGTTRLQLVIRSARQGWLLYEIISLVKENDAMYIYEGHMGSLYTSDELLDYNDLYCEQCGDSDNLIGYADTKEEAWALLKDDTDINGSGGWDYDYVRNFIEGNWDE